uniref:NADH-ubiquinone oxidoreductase chain 5 n=1 Tax=Ledropsis sp. 1 XYW-2023a TaxID=3078463 RepID=A0AB38ZHA3_9HEMI
MLNKNNMFYWWSMLFMVSSFALMMMAIKLMMSNKTIMMEWEILKSNSYEMCFLMLMDWMSLMFMSTVLLISSMILLYSSMYMGTNKNELGRFISLINLFILSMMMMIISPNMISIMLGWDGLGLVSYCLVIFYSSKKSYNSGMITCLTNRLGDIGLLISIAWTMSYGSWHFMLYKEMYTEMISYLIMISCFTKSAQMPFYSWLPEAMAAPTPISALVHSSTLVTAGVYLSIRFINKINTSYLLMISILTTLMSSACANFEFDLKKIIALSTLSQLGMMMSSTFMGMKELSFMHLITHATFKSLLFMCAGIMIFYNNNNQDLRNLSLICKTLPMTSSCFLVSTMALCGIPFMTGFYSKDTIMENMSMKNLNLTTFSMMYMSLGLTIMYSSRMTYFIMMKQKSTIMSIKIKKMNKMKLSILILTMLSTTLGSMLMWELSMNLKFVTLTSSIKILPLLMISMGMWTGLELFGFKKQMLSQNIYKMNSNMWNILAKMNKMQKETFSKSMLYKIKLNSEWGEMYGALGMSNTLMKLSKMTLLSKNNMFMLSIMTWMTMMM